MLDGTLRHITPDRQCLVWRMAAKPSIHHLLGLQIIQATLSRMRLAGFTHTNVLLQGQQLDLYFLRDASSQETKFCNRCLNALVRTLLSRLQRIARTS